MRHLNFGRRLGRDTNARKALAKNLASALFEKGQVITTLAKAKFAKTYVEKLITQAQKLNDLNATRVIASLVSKQAFSKLRQLAPGFAQRPGGYTRIIKLVPRSGDAAPMARLELLKIEKPAIIQSSQEKQKQQTVPTHTKQNEKPKPKA